MGKSKKVKKTDINLLRNYVTRRKAAKTATIVSAVLFFLSCIFVGGLYPEKNWIIVAFLVLYTLCFFWLRQASNCPYCGRPIMSKFNKRTHCPVCHRPIKPNAPARDAMASLK